jgi:hypothetical protein
MKQKSKFFFIIAFFAFSNLSFSQIDQSKGSFEDKFRQLDEVFPSPNLSRPATGEPGPDYWQQRADYKIKIKLDEKTRSVRGSEVITYTNNSPLKLNYVWLQLDQNIFDKDSINNLTRPWWGGNKSVDFSTLRRQNFMDNFNGGMQELSIKVNGEDAAINMVGTHVRINLNKPLMTGESTELEIKWGYALVEENAVRARNGYESFEDGNDIFLLAQWYPRITVFSDYEGWHNKEFIGNGEFTLEFGDFEVDITVPSSNDSYPFLALTAFSSTNAYPHLISSSVDSPVINGLLRFIRTCVPTILIAASSPFTLIESSCMPPLKLSIKFCLLKVEKSTLLFPPHHGRVRLLIESLSKIF